MQLLELAALVPLTSLSLFNNVSVIVNYVNCISTVLHTAVQILSCLFLYRKLLLFLEKSIKLLTLELLFLAQICTRSFVGWGFAPDLQRSTDPIASSGEEQDRKGEEGRGHP